ncbi:hypothetical protein G8A07_15715 [Roseateles sp. DAIF2]|uniref:putative holin n=1 Tax=Roseateles sp. DAIF2 TaxID=2714952 RepID=UPI0018A291A6|nr:putative holin [Roseateles sp. DAIF2]QPF74222.1 hypothetical protein G8A07_15715 [Roseateles sp. DAIF2]
MTKSHAPTRKPFAQRCVARLRRPPRLSGWFLIAIALAALVWSFAPHQLPVSLYKLSLVTLAGVVGYWLDRSMFPYARPDDFLPESRQALDLADKDASCTLLVAPDAEQLRLAGAAMLRRALIVAATMLAMGLGA